jgi:6-phosphogluconolactonase
MYLILAQRPLCDLVDWPQVHFFWGDERCVPPEDLNSNYRTARELLLSHVQVPAEHIHRMRTEMEPELAAQDYALVLGRSADPPLQWPRFDLVLLGLGKDGHTASLFPGASLSPGQAAAANKSGIVASILYGAFEPERLPAQKIRPSDGELIWLLDAGAAEG